MSKFLKEEIKEIVVSHKTIYKRIDMARTELNI